VIGNFNNLFMLRVRETATAELITNQRPKVQIDNSTQQAVRTISNWMIRAADQCADDRACTRRWSVQGQCFSQRILCKISLYSSMSVNFHRQRLEKTPRATPSQTF
jgi:hypothetical protein